MIGFIELLQQTTTLDHIQAEYLSYISSSARNLLHVLNDILTFSKLEAGKVSLEKKQFDLRECLEGVIDTFRGLVEEKNQHTELRLYVPHTLPTLVVGDEFRLTQVLTKYLSFIVLSIYYIWFLRCYTRYTILDLSS